MIFRFEDYIFDALVVVNMETESSSPNTPTTTREYKVCQIPGCGKSEANVEPYPPTPQKRGIA